MIPPLSLYLHFPWCVKKCPYCDFNSHQIHQDQYDEQAYIAAMLRDIDQTPEAIRKRPIHTVFMGGGTPSLLSTDAMKALWDGLHRRLDFSRCCEQTIEMNPATVTDEKIACYHALGIHRLSLGVQSFSDTSLQTLGRIHSSDIASQAIETILTYPIQLNIDLMYGLPHQSELGAKQDLMTALNFSPHHLSWYELTLEPNTPFYRHPPPRPDEDQRFTMHELGHQLLTQHGYCHYEISAFCRDDYVCQHNRHVWQFGDYLGIGAGAWGKYTVAPGHAIRTMRYRHPKRYLQVEDTLQNQARIPQQDLGFEYLLNVMRLREPISLDTMHAMLGFDYASTVKPAYEHACQQGLLRCKKDHWIITERGSLYLNDLLSLFMTKDHDHA